MEIQYFKKIILKLILQIVLLFSLCAGCLNLVFLDDDFDKHLYGFSIRVEEDMGIEYLYLSGGYFYRTIFTYQTRNEWGTPITESKEIIIPSNNIYRTSDETSILSALSPSFTDIKNGKFEKVGKYSGPEFLENVVMFNSKYFAVNRDIENNHFIWSSDNGEVWLPVSSKNFNQYGTDTRKLKNLFKKLLRYKDSLILVLASSNQSGSSSAVEFLQSTNGKEWQLASLIDDVYNLGAVFIYNEALCASVKYFSKATWEEYDKLLKTEDLKNWNEEANLFLEFAAVQDLTVWGINGNKMWKSNNLTDWTLLHYSYAFSGESMKIINNELYIGGKYRTMDGNVFYSWLNEKFTLNPRMDAKYQNNDFYILQTEQGYAGISGHPDCHFVSPDGLIWEKVDYSDKMFPPPRTDFSCFYFNEFIWIAGGVQASEYPIITNDVWRSKDGMSWEQVTAHASWQQNFRLTSCLIDNKLYLLGGQNNEIWETFDGKTWKKSGTFPVTFGSFSHIRPDFCSAINLNNKLLIEDSTSIIGSPESDWKKISYSFPGEKTAIKTLVIKLENSGRTIQRYISFSTHPEKVIILLPSKDEKNVIWTDIPYTCDEEDIPYFKTIFIRNNKIYGARIVRDETLSRNPVNLETFPLPLDYDFIQKNSKTPYESISY